MEPVKQQQVPRPSSLPVSFTDRPSVNQQKQQHLRWNVKNVIRSCCCSVWPSTSSSALLSALQWWPLYTEKYYKWKNRLAHLHAKRTEKSSEGEGKRKGSATSAGQLLHSPKNSIPVATCSHTSATLFLSTSLQDLVCSNICDHSEEHWRGKCWQGRTATDRGQ